MVVDTTRRSREVCKENVYSLYASEMVVACSKVWFLNEGTPNFEDVRSEYCKESKLREKEIPISGARSSKVGVEGGWAVRGSLRFR